MKRNLRDTANEIEEESLDELLQDLKLEEGEPTEFPLWYKQFLQLPEETRKKIAALALERVKETKPESYDFIRNFKCQLVGVTPNIMYALIKKSDGDITTTWVHGYSMPTLLYWCPQGKFGFFVNANLDYNDTVLNHVEGNKSDRLIKGFTA